MKVQVWDGRDEHRKEQDTSSLNDNDDTNDTAIIDDEITVTIMVSDVAERPAAPTVTVTSPANGTESDGDVGRAPDEHGASHHRLPPRMHRSPRCPTTNVLGIIDLSALVTNGVGTSHDNRSYRGQILPSAVAGG